MGGNNSTISLDAKIWDNGYSSEFYINNYNRNKTMSTYTDNYLQSFGHIIYPDISIYEKEFEIIDKKTSFYDSRRTSYKGDKTKCCLDNLYYYTNSSYMTCDPLSKTLNSNYCDDIFFEHCINKNLNNDKCNPWIKSMVLRENYAKLVSACSGMNYKQKYCKVFLESLREFNSDKLNLIADKIIDSIPLEEKKKEFLCLFPPENIKNKKTDTYIECWYKPCVLTENWKLKTENIQRQKFCRINICDIKIYDLNINNNDLIIICQTPMQLSKLNIYYPLKSDKNTPFRTINRNNLFFLLLMLSILYI